MKKIFFLLMAVSPAAAQGPLVRLGWMAGCWRSDAENRAIVEMWMPPSGGLMVGGSRTVRSGQASAYEHLRIRAVGDQIVYTAVPSGQAGADFRSTLVSDSGFTVENLEHDFPQRIIYRQTGPHTLAVRVEGPGRNGAGAGADGFDIVFRRVSCELAGGLEGK